MPRGRVPVRGSKRMLRVVAHGTVSLFRMSAPSAWYYGFTLDGKGGAGEWSGGWEYGCSGALAGKAAEIHGSEWAYYYNLKDNKLYRHAGYVEYGGGKAVKLEPVKGW